MGVPLFWFKRECVKETDTTNVREQANKKDGRYMAERRATGE